MALTHSMRAFPSSLSFATRRRPRSLKARSLSHHAGSGEKSREGDGTKKSAFTVLVLSNGHGEDTIAASIVSALLVELRSQEKETHDGLVGDRLTSSWSNSREGVFVREVQALPIVGEGAPLRKLGLSIVCPTRVMPSGGFISGRPASALRDIRHGLAGLTLGQVRSLRLWVEDAYDSGATPCLLAVGDVVPLAFAALACRFYRKRGRKKPKDRDKDKDNVEKIQLRRKEPVIVFVGCAKSQYYLDKGVHEREDEGVDYEKRQDRKRVKCVYYPWERWLLSHECCKLVAPRDQLTAQVLAKYLRGGQEGKVSYLGNPMMDNIEEQRTGLLQNAAASISCGCCDKWVTLLPGTRKGEVLRNLQLILRVCATLVAMVNEGEQETQAATTPSSSFSSPSMGFLLSIPPGCTKEELDAVVTNNGWEKVKATSHSLSLLGLEEYTRNDRHQLQETRHCCFDGVLMVSSQDAFPDLITDCDVAIAMAGTATEQCVGFGKPAVTLVGHGPQFNKQFALAQEKLLGSDSVKVARTVGEAAKWVQMLLGDQEALQRAKENGVERMGHPGASKRLAKAMLQAMKS